MKTAGMTVVVLILLLTGCAGTTVIDEPFVDVRKNALNMLYHGSGMALTGDPVTTKEAAQEGQIELDAVYSRDTSGIYIPVVRVKLHLRELAERQTKVWVKVWRLGILLRHRDRWRERRLLLTLKSQEAKSSL